MCGNVGIKTLRWKHSAPPPLMALQGGPYYTVLPPQWRVEWWCGVATLHYTIPLHHMEILNHHTHPPTTIYTNTSSFIHYIHSLKVLQNSLNIRNKI